MLADTERYGHLPAFNADLRRVRPAGALVRGRVRARSSGSAAARSGWPACSPRTFVATAGLPADRGRSRPGLAAWHRRKTEIYTERGRGRGLPGRARRTPASSPQRAAAGWRLAVASTSAEPSVRAVLDARRRRPDAGQRLRGVRRRRRAAQEARPGHLPAGGATSCGADPAETLVVEDSPQRPARRDRRRAAPPGDRQRLHRATRTSPARRWSSPRSATRRRAGSRCWPTRTGVRPGALRRPGRPRGLHGRDRIGRPTMADRVTLADVEYVVTHDRADRRRQREVLRRPGRGRRRRRLRLLAGPRLRDRARRLGRASTAPTSATFLKKVAIADHQPDRRHLRADLGHRVPARRRHGQATSPKLDGADAGGDAAGGRRGDQGPRQGRAGRQDPAGRARPGDRRARAGAGGRRQ